MKQNYCWASNQSIADDIGVSYSSVLRSIRVLLKESLIKPVGEWKKGETCRWTITQKAKRTITKLSELIEERNAERDNSKKHPRWTSDHELLDLLNAERGRVKII